MTERETGTSSSSPAEEEGAVDAGRELDEGSGKSGRMKARGCEEASASPGVADYTSASNLNRLSSLMQRHSQVRRQQSEEGPSAASA